VKHEGFADAVAPERRVGVRRICIRIADVAIAGLCLALLAPLLILVVVIVRINSPGSLLVRQWRYGYRNRPILIRKFRTTFTAGKEAVFPTLVSTLLHQTGIEDLPMLGNVLRGENVDFWSGAERSPGHCVERQQARNYSLGGIDQFRRRAGMRREARFDFTAAAQQATTTPASACAALRVRP
jgi:hypothetical protein